MLLTTVTAVDPLANSHTAPVSTDVVATFDQDINAATATPQNFVVHSLARGQLIGSAATVSASGAALTLDPASDFLAGELVQASVTAAIESTGGQASGPHVWQLRTAVGSGSGTFSDSGQSLGTMASQRVRLGDVDGDGDLDAFVANHYRQANGVWLNQGGAQGGAAGTFSDSGQSLGSWRSRDVSLGDVDGDGDLDAFVANSGPSTVAAARANRVWINQGGAQSGAAGTFSFNGQNLADYESRGVSLGDVDGDGDLDAFVANDEGEGNRVWLNQGGAQGGTAGTFGDSNQTLGGSYSRDVALGDVDGDGDLDAFVANYLGANLVWLNQGGAQGGTAGAFSDSGQSLGGSDSQSVSLGDLDADGDLDAFVANGQANRVWINQGGAQSGTAGTFSDSGQGLGSLNSYGVSLGDLDADGDLDAFITNVANQGNRVWINQAGAQSGTAGVFSDGSQSLGNFTSHGVALGDVDGDGDLDAFIANSAQGNKLWLGTGGNKAPTLEALPDLTVNEDDPQQTVNLAGISAGSGETQPLKVTATSGNTSLIPDPTVAYTSPNATGTLMFTAVADASGSATISVTIEDGGPDLDLSTTSDNAQFSRTFDVVVNAVNDTPTLDSLLDITINQPAAQQTLNLAGISAGGGETQPLQVAAVSDNTGLIPNPAVNYSSPDATGTLTFTPVAGGAGTANVTVTVEDGGLDNNLSTAADNAKLDRTFVVTVNAATTSVSGAVFNNGSANRSGLASLTLQFSESTTVDAAGSLMLWNHTEHAAVDVSAAPLLNNGSNAVTWNLSSLVLPAGNYTATLPQAAASLAATHTESFHLLPGDSDGDGSVAFGDFGDLAANFNLLAGPIYGPGDMNGDGNVNFTDFGTLATNFNESLAALALDFGDAPESGTSFPTTLVNNGAGHVLGSGLFLGATVDAEADGQPDPTAAGDGADDDGVAFGTLTAGSGGSVTVTAAVPGAAVLNAWIDFNADGDWGDAGEQVFADQAISNGANNLTAAIPAGAAVGQAMARFRLTSLAGYSYDGLAKDGEVEDYQVTIAAAKASSGRATRSAAALQLWSAAFVVEPGGQQAAGVVSQQQLAPWASSTERSAPRITGVAFETEDAAERKRAGDEQDAALLDEQLVDQVFQQERELLPFLTSADVGL